MVAAGDIHVCYARLNLPDLWIFTEIRLRIKPVNVCCQTEVPSPRTADFLSQLSSIPALRLPSVKKNLFGLWKDGWSHILPVQNKKL